MLYGTERFSDVDKYMSELTENFRKKHNATTLELPLTEPYFDLPINDTLFSEYDRSTRPQKSHKDRDQSADDLIYERKVIENRVKKQLNQSDSPDFRFDIKYGKFKQIFRSKENMGKVFLNLLNAISLWSGFGAPFQLFIFKWCGFGQPNGIFERPSSSN